MVFVLLIFFFPIIKIFSVPDMTLLAAIEGIDCLQPVLSAEPPRRSNAREPLKEVLVAHLGDSSAAQPFLIVRLVDLALYRDR